MSCKNKCRNHFKGIENFLRRVAFNLGNTPSQTEVKIISCIPIDVTDLQQKIVSLEKELEDARNKPPECLTATVNAAQVPMRQAAVFSVCSPVCRPSSPPKSLCDSYTHMQDLYATTSTAVPICTCWSDDPNDAASLRDELAACESTCKKSVFKKLKKRRDKLKLKRDKNKPQLVYYAQTSNNPFNSYRNRPVHSNSPATDDTMSRAYISDMIRKQYTPVPIVQDYSIMSEFSSPICRDVEQGCAVPQEPDACSCCRGASHNADHQRATLPDVLRAPPARPATPYASNTDFYDTTLYDMVPVRDRPIRTTKVHDKSTRRSPKSNHSERSRSRTKIHYVINNRVRAPVTGRLNSRKTPARMVNIKISPKRKIVSEREPTETSNSCCFDCGNVYVKRVFTNSKPPAAPKPPVTTSHKNVECLTHALNDSECQTTTTQSVQIDQELLEEKKTEATLNQIKTILQTVLTEVKTNTQLKQMAEDKSTKDAVVQKGASQGNMPGCSSLLHSYTYSPYNINPYLASCSRQMTSGQCCFPNIPYTSGKCLQNFPVFIQTPGRHMCSSCYRNSSHIPKVGQAKQANTMATNTDSKERSKETEKLIKEIYKSMTVNMDFAGKDTSLSECNQAKCARQGSANKPVYRPTALHESVRKFVKVIESRNVQQSTQPLTALNSKLMSSNTMSMRSQFVSTTDTERRLRNNRLENYLKAVESQKRQKRIEEEREYEEVSLETSASEEEPTSSSDTEGRVVYTRVQEPTEKTETATQKTEPNRKGLLRKMLKSVKLFHTKTKKKEEQVQVANEEDEESEGNSEDYQTVYSQRVERAPRGALYPVRAVRSPARLRAHSKISYSRHMRDRNQERSRKSPYMEQEYRRHWNERFHEHRHRYSSEGQYSSSTATRPVYWQNYEARSALVKPTSPAIDAQPVRDTSPGSHEDDTAPASNKETTAKKGLAWLKKHRLGIHCGPQWKKFILEG